MSAGLRDGYKQTEVGVIPEDWGVRQIIDVCDFIVPGRNKPKFSNDTIPWITTPDLEDGGKVSESRLGLSVSRADANSVGSRVVPAGAVVMSCVGELGITAYAGRDIVINQQLHAFIPSKLIDGHFLLHAIRTRKSYLEGIATKTALPYLNKDNCNSIRLPFPPLQEQRAIATALSDTDALLAKLDEFIAKKRDLKQAAMQQLLTGQTRLPEFGGAWEVKRLGDVGNCLRGVTYQGDNDLWPHDTAHTKRLLRSNNVQNATVVITDIQYVNAERVSANQMLRANDILICMANGSKALVGKAGMFSVNDGYEYTFGAFMGCFRSNSVASNSAFMFFLFQTGRYRNYINNLLAGSSINNLSPSSIESLEFQIPPMLEQTAIAAVLSDMEAELAALEARRDKTRALKQGMMQELLTGRIRLLAN